MLVEPHEKHSLWDLLFKSLQICQKPRIDPTLFFDIADSGTEQMWTDYDGTIYVYYTGPSFRYAVLLASYDFTVYAASLVSISSIGKHV